MKRFWNKVEKTHSCWIWTGAKSTYGHGRFKISGKLYSPHRLVYEWEYGEIPEGLLICHHCDNPACVNPDHLFMGTYSDNMKDAYAKGRIKHLRKGHKSLGEKNGAAKLTEDQVIAIRETYKKGDVLQKDLAKKYGVGNGQISRIIAMKKWAHVSG